MTAQRRGGDAARDQCVLHRAALVAPVCSPPITDGAVLARNGVVLAVGKYRSVDAQCPAGTQKVDHGPTALLPALVNSHTHLELSALEGTIPFPQESFAAWLQAMLPRRRSLTPREERAGILRGKRQLVASGVGLCGDITNQAGLVEERRSLQPTDHIFLEMLGFNVEDLDAAFQPSTVVDLLDAGQDDLRLSLAAHACYSTSPELIGQSKEWCRRRMLPFSIHTAEHLDEVQFLKDGTGFCRLLLETLGRWAPRWTPPRMTPVEYLSALGVLDEKTLLVHAVHMTERDWEIVSKSGCSVCFCPRSNHNTGAGRADAERALRMGITAALGTDSLASNCDLNLFAEASYVLDHYPGIDPGAVLAMITQRGAQALGQDARYGSIAPGKASAFLAVSVPHDCGASQLIEIIIRQGKEGAWQWASSSMND